MNLSNAYQNDIFCFFFNSVDLNDNILIAILPFPPRARESQGDSTSFLYFSFRKLFGVHYILS